MGKIVLRQLHQMQTKRQDINERPTMRADIHPEYQEVLFHDTNADVYFLTRSTIKSKTTRDYEGKTYPYVALDVSSASHPFYTGEQRKAQNEGRVATFNKRFGAFASRGKKA